MGDEHRSELQQELDRRDEEILRLRDLLIGKDAELGAAKGRLAELEHYSQRLMGLAARVQARVPGAMRLIGAALRRLQGRRGRERA
jgi:hypothetical protein